MLMYFWGLVLSTIFAIGIAGLIILSVFVFQIGINSGLWWSSLVIGVQIGLNVVILENIIKGMIEIFGNPFKG
jgi:hypothetical protein